MGCTAAELRDCITRESHDKVMCVGLTVYFMTDKRIQLFHFVIRGRLKIREWKMRHDVTGLENARVELHGIGKPL